MIIGPEFENIIDRFSDSRILVIGDLILDSYTYGRVDRISPEAPVPIVLVSEDSHRPGGAGNVANNIRCLGGMPLPCGYIGNDEAGKNLTEDLFSRGIPVDGLLSVQNMRTIQKTRIIAQRQQVIRLDRESPFIPLTPDEEALKSFVKAHLNKCDVIIMSDYGKGTINEGLLEWIRNQPEKPVICLDPKEKNFPFYQDMDIITPNKLEAEKMAKHVIRNEEDLNYVAKAIFNDFRPKRLLITLGEMGMALFETGNLVCMIPTRARQVFDVSGAGDTVISIYALAVACGATPTQAAILANAGAGVVVGKLGTASLDAYELREALKWSPDVRSWNGI